ncbi:endolytic transglycosylase MltG [bacterium]|nr:endolytic transglycosylase MltG [bacterium]
MDRNFGKIGILVGGILFLLLLFFWQGIFLPKNGAKEQKLFSVKKGDSAFEIGKNLEEEKLIKSRIFFDLYVVLTNKAEKLKAGSYYLSPSFSVKEIVQKITRGQTIRIKITIPEGFRLSQIEEKLRTSLSDLKVKDFKREFSFLESAPDNASLEGFLFPDTYYFSGEETNRQIVDKFLRNFDKQLKPDLREEIKKQGKTIFEIIIMASLIEKEVRDDNEKALVSGILWKRLKSRMPLQVDATLVYICKNCKGLNFSQMRKKIGEMKIIDSPYNTYKYLGLPPAPICNPGLESIKAAVYPKESQYWYYFSSSDGKTFFSRTLFEHNFKKARYLD